MNASRFRTGNGSEHVVKFFASVGLFRHITMHVFVTLGIREQAWSLDHRNVAACTASFPDVEVAINVFRGWCEHRRRPVNCLATTAIHKSQR